MIDLIGGPDRDRTDDLFHAMEARSQLRHRPTYFRVATFLLSPLRADSSNFGQIGHEFCFCPRISFPSGEIYGTAHHRVRLSTSSWLTWAGRRGNSGRARIEPSLEGYPHFVKFGSYSYIFRLKMPQIPPTCVKYRHIASNAAILSQIPPYCVKSHQTFL